MKKLVMATAMLAAMAASVFAVAHPRTYKLDLADSGATCSIAFNSYGPNYQGTPDFTKFMKADKPMKGDTFEVHLKFKSNIDLPLLLVSVVDTSPQANYWTLLTENQQIEGIKANQVVDKVLTFPAIAACKGQVKLCLQYDNADQDTAAFPLVKKGAKLTTMKTVGTTDTSKEVVVRKTPKTWNVNLSKYAAFLEVKTNHPWVNGAQDMSVISNYETVAEISKAFDNGRSLPIKGDTLIITYRASSNADIDTLYVDVIENTEAVGWWAVLSEGGPQEFAKDIKKGVPFDAKATFKLAKGATDGISLQIFYDVGAAKGPSILKYAK